MTLTLICPWYLSWHWSC